MNAINDREHPAGTTVQLIGFTIPLNKGTLTGNYEYEKAYPKTTTEGQWYRAEVLFPEGYTRWYWHSELAIPSTLTAEQRSQQAKFRIACH